VIVENGSELLVAVWAAFKRGVPNDIGWRRAFPIRILYCDRSWSALLDWMHPARPKHDGNDDGLSVNRRSPRETSLDARAARS
jgi:hypothetical protein